VTRLAGSSSYYTVGILDSAGRPTPYTYRLPSVTHILDAVIAKPRLMNWYYRVAIEGVAALYQKYGTKLPQDEQSLHELMKREGLTPYAKRDTGGNIGKEAHSDVEKWCAHEPVVWSEHSIGFANWVAHRGLDRGHVIASEIPLVSFKHRFAGTLDLVYRHPELDKVVLADVKTAKYVQWVHLVQCQAYKIAWEEDGREPIWKTSVLHIRPTSEIDGGFRELTTDVLEPDCFLRVLDIYRSLPDDWMPEEIVFGEEENTSGRSEVQRQPALAEGQPVRQVVAGDRS
jgi:hypothetical protein